MCKLLSLVHTIENGLLYTVRTLQGKLRLGMTTKTIVQCMVTAIAAKHLGAKTSKNKAAFDSLVASI